MLSFSSVDFLEGVTWRGKYTVLNDSPAEKVLKKVLTQELKLGI